MHIPLCRDGTRLNTIPEIVSQKDASQNGVLGPFFLAFA
jgi:hypothetical protein